MPKKEPKFQKYEILLFVGKFMILDFIQFKGKITVIIFIFIYCCRKGAVNFLKKLITNNINKIIRKINKRLKNLNSKEKTKTPSSLMLGLFI